MAKNEIKFESIGMYVYGYMCLRCNTSSGHRIRLEEAKNWKKNHICEDIRLGRRTHDEE